MKLIKAFYGIAMPYIKHKQNAEKEENNNNNRFGFGLMLIWTVLMLLLQLTSRAQATGGLKNGDAVPDIEINNVLNYNRPAFKMSDFKGKLVILDFWAPWCSGCLANFPKMENLQKTFGDQVQVMPVTYQDKKTITNFFASANGKKYKMATVCNDTVLNKLFPHQGIPYCIWINSSGMVIAITGAEEVTEQNVQNAMNGHTEEIVGKKERNPNKPLFLSDDFQAKDTLQFYSLLSKGDYFGFGAGNHYRKSGKKTIGVAVTNLNLQWIYETAAIQLFLQKGEDFTEKRMLVTVKDASKITLNAESSAGGYNLYDTDNLYNYDLIVPPAQAGNLYQYMLEDLNRYTAYLGDIEKRSVKCLVLKRTGPADHIHSNGGPRSNTLFVKAPYALQNCPVRNLIVDLENLEISNLPIIDGTGYQSNIDIALPKSSGVPQIKEALQKYGLDLVEENRDIDMFLLKDKQQPINP